MMAPCTRRRVALATWSALAATSLFAQQDPARRWLATEVIGRFPPPAALAAVGLAGTDLGVSFACGERLVFLFGDSWTPDRKDQDTDTVATAPLAWPAKGLPAPTWLTTAGRFQPLRVRDVPLGGMEVPVEGLVVGDRSYVFFSSGWEARAGRHSHSALAHTKGLAFDQLELDHRVATDKFVNVSIVADGDDLWIFGTGAYRKSSVFLAKVAAAELANRSAWRYWPDLVPDESRARPIVVSDCLGEISVRRLPSGILAMTMNAALPRGIHLRTALQPTGPWSDPVLLFDPSRDAGYGRTMHQRNAAVGYDDGLAEPGREDQWGGEYGPYLVPEWSRSPAPGVDELVYTLSTWNPYGVLLVRSTVVAPGVVWSAPAEVARPAPAKGLRNLSFAGGKLSGWQQEGDAFVCQQRPDPTWSLCTYVAPAGDAVRGRLWQEFTVPALAKELRGFVSGGTESLRLVRGDEVLRSTRGPRSNDVEVLVRWRLDDLRGQRLRLEVVDDSTARWGFVTVRGLELIE